MSTEALAEQLLSFQSRLLLAIHGIPEERIRQREADGRWSVFHVVTHLADLELLTTVRISKIVAEDDPQLPLLPQTEWAERLHAHESLGDVLENFWHSRRRNVAALRALDGEALTRTAMHPDYGRLTVPALLERLAAHGERHFGQIERIKTTLGLTATATPSLAGVTAAHATGAPTRSPGPGIRVRELWRRGVSSALQVEIDAGAVWPSLDYHVPGPEEVFVVSGDFEDGANRYEAGTFLHHPAGSSHVPASENGCVLFLFYPEG